MFSKKKRLLLLVSATIANLGAQGRQNQVYVSEVQKSAQQASSVKSDSFEAIDFVDIESLGNTIAGEIAQPVVTGLIKDQINTIVDKIKMALGSLQVSAVMKNQINMVADQIKSIVASINVTGDIKMQINAILNQVNSVVRTAPLSEEIKNKFTMIFNQVRSIAGSIQFAGDIKAQFESLINVSKPIQELIAAIQKVALVEYKKAADLTAEALRAAARKPAEIQKQQGLEAQKQQEIMKKQQEEVESDDSLSGDEPAAEEEATPVPDQEQEVETLPAQASNDARKASVADDVGEDEASDQEVPVVLEQGDELVAVLTEAASPGGEPAEESDWE